MADINSLEYLSGQLRQGATKFSGAAQTLRQQAQRLDWSAQDLANGAASWAGAGSQNFNDAWQRYHDNTQKSATALDNTAQALTTLAQKIDGSVQQLRNAQAMQMAVGALVVADALQGGLDPVTDASTLETLELATTLASEAEMALVEADAAIGAELDQIIGAIEDAVDSGDMANVGGVPGDVIFDNVLFGEGEGGNSSDSPTINLKLWEKSLPLHNGGNGDKLPSVDVTWERSLIKPITTWKESGNFGSVPVHNVGTLNVANLDAGVHMGPSELGAAAGFSLFDWGDQAVFGNTNFGLTLGGDLKGPSVNAQAGFVNNSVGADVDASLVTLDGDVGMNVAGYNVGVTGEVGAKWEWGFELGEATQVKLPFLSFGVTFGEAKTGMPETKEGSW